MAGSVFTVDSEHWDRVWSERRPEDVSWYQEDPALSLALVERFAEKAAAIVDVGGGASRLVDRLLDAGFSHLTVVDVAARSLQVAQDRLGVDAGRVRWVVADATTLDLGLQVDLWHDRAAFHFLMDDDDRARYVDRVLAHLRPGGHLILATFAPDGPESCSGLPVRRNDSTALDQVVGDEFLTVEHVSERHTTPSGATQHFLYGVYRRSIT